MSWNKDLLKYKRSTYSPQHALQKEEKIVTKWVWFQKEFVTNTFKIIQILEDNCNSQNIRGLVSLKQNVVVFFGTFNPWCIEVNEVLDMHFSH